MKHCGYKQNLKHHIKIKNEIMTIAASLHRLNERYFYHKNEKRLFKRGMSKPNQNHSSWVFFAVHRIQLANKKGHSTHLPRDEGARGGRGRHGPRDRLVVAARRIKL